MLIEGSGWFSVDHSQVGQYFNDVFKNYKDWKVKGKRQGYYSRSNFSFNKMEKQLDDLLTKYIPDLPKEVNLNLPSIGSTKNNLPKLKKV